MSRVLAVLAACWVLCARFATADADNIDLSVSQLDSRSEKVRLAAALALSKSRDPRAVIALAGTLRNDEDARIRRIAALALGKMIDARTAEDARELALGSLDAAATSDLDERVREHATTSQRALAVLRRKKGTGPPVRGDKPEVFINIDATTDQTAQMPSGAGDRLAKIVKRNIEGKGYSTTWPGGLPTSAELTANRSRAFVVASTVKKIQISKVGTQTEIACTFTVRIAPWSGRDGGEKWEANKAASASGSAKAMTGPRTSDVANGVRDCLEAVAEDVTSRQVVPFLKRLATTGT
jgi:HEAT repeat protein